MICGHLFVFFRCFFGRNCWTWRLKLVPKNQDLCFDCFRLLLPWSMLLGLGLAHLDGLSRRYPFCLRCHSILSSVSFWSKSETENSKGEAGNRSNSQEIIFEYFSLLKYVLTFPSLHVFSEAERAKFMNKKKVPTCCHFGLNQLMIH